MLLAILNYFLRMLSVYVPPCEGSDLRAVISIGGVTPKSLEMCLNNHSRLDIVRLLAFNRSNSEKSAASQCLGDGFTDSSK